MKKKFYLEEISSLIIIIFDVICILTFFLPSGRVDYLPNWLVDITLLFNIYVIFGGMALTSIIGIIINIDKISRKRKEGESIISNIVCIAFFVATIPVMWFIYTAVPLPDLF